jgi:hypothetical protein
MFHVFLTATDIYRIVLWNANTHNFMGTEKWLLIAKQITASQEYLKDKLYRG